MRDSHEIPGVTPELIEALETLFPDKCPTLTMSDREVWAATGATRVISRLKDQLRRDEEDAAESLETPFVQAI